MQKRSIALLALFLLAAVLAYYYYYYEAESLMFEGPSATLVLVGSVFLTGFLLSLPSRAPHGHGHGDGHHGHDHGHHHGHGHEGHEHHEHPAMPPTGKQG